MIEPIVIGLVAVFVLVVRLVPALRPGSVENGVWKWSREFGLTVTDDVRPFLLRRRRATWVGYGIGLAAGVAVGGALQSAVSVVRWTLLGDFAVQLSWLVLGGLGALLGGAIGARLAPPSGPRVARERAVTLADYVDPVERVVPVVVAVLAAAVGLVALLHGSTGAASTAAAASGLGSAAFVGICEAVAVVIVTRPQRADTPHLLAWIDALRAEVLRDTLGLGAVLAAASLTVSLPVALTALGTGAVPGQVRLWVLLGIVAAALPLAIRGSLAGPTRYFLRRLWPKVAAELAEPERPMEEVRP